MQNRLRPHRDGHVTIVVFEYPSIQRIPLLTRFSGTMSMVCSRGLLQVASRYYMHLQMIIRMRTRKSTMAGIQGNTLGRPASLGTCGVGAMGAMRAHDSSCSFSPCLTAGHIATHWTTGLPHAHSGRNAFTWRDLGGEFVTAYRPSGQASPQWGPILVLSIPVCSPARQDFEGSLGIWPSVLVAYQRAFRLRLTIL